MMSWVWMGRVWVWDELGLDGSGWDELGLKV